MAGSDPLGDALRALDTQDHQLQAVIMALADELRSSHAEFQQHVRSNEAEKANASSRFDAMQRQQQQLAKQTADSKKTL